MTNAAAGTNERRFLITGKGAVALRQDGQTLARVALDPVPDLIPLVTLPKPPQHGQRGALTIFYKFEDDYGICQRRGAVPAARRRAG